MRVIVERSFRTPSTSLFAIYTNPDFYHQRYRESGISQYRLDRFEPTDEGFAVAIDLEVGLQSEHIPAAFARKLGGLQPVRYQLNWQASAPANFVGQYCYETLNLPVLLAGQASIEAQPEGCLHRVDIDVSCGIPLIGRLAEQIMAERARQEIEADMQALERWLYRAQTKVIA